MSTIINAEAYLDSNQDNTIGFIRYDSSIEKCTGILDADDRQIKQNEIKQRPCADIIEAS